MRDKKDIKMNIFAVVKEEEERCLIDPSTASPLIYNWSYSNSYTASNILNI
jgi:hypothetical protein